MTRKRQPTTSQQWAEFRFAVIGNLIASPRRRGQLGSALSKLAAKVWTHPITGEAITVAYSTIERWYYLAVGAEDSPIEALAKTRRDAGLCRAIPRQARSFLESATRCKPSWSYQKSYDKLAVFMDKRRLGPPPSYSAVRRFLCSSTPSKKAYTVQEVERLNGLVASLRRTVIAHSVVIHLLEATHLRAKPGCLPFKFGRLGASEKFYVLCRWWDYKKAGGTMDDYGQAIGLSEPTVSRWSTDYARFGKDGLVARKRRKFHNKTKAKETTKRILELFHSQPGSYGINRTTWTGKSLAAAFEKEFDERIAPSTARRHLRKSGYTMRRANQVLTSPDPEYREKVELLLRILGSLGSDDLFFFVDEMGPLRIRKYGGWSYVKKGSVKSIPQLQPNKGSITLIAALSATTNQVTWFFDSAKNSRGMVDLIELLFNQHYQKKRIFICWDAASWHDSTEVRDRVDWSNRMTEVESQGPLIEIVPLPSRAQFLDVIESVFGSMKRAVIHNSDYRSTTKMKEAVSRHFSERNVHFIKNPRRAGKKIWEVDFFSDFENIRSGNYKEW